MASALDASLKSLSLSSSLNAQIYSLLEQDKFSDSLKLANSRTEQKVSNLYLAYAQYRLGKEEECLKLLGDSVSRASLHLRAQALYRLERPSASEIIALKQNYEVENEESDFAVNQMAVAVQNALLSKSQLDVSLIEAGASHEYLFNLALYHLSTGKPDEAVEVLQRATEALKALNLEPEEYELEIAPIEAQLAHLTSDDQLNLQARNRKSDSLTGFLTGINFLDSDNPFILHKAYHAESKLRPTSRLFSSQDRYVAYNRIVVMHSIGLNIKRAVKKYIAHFSGVDEERCASLTSLMYSRYTTESLSDILKKEPDNTEAAIALISKLVRKPKGVSRCLDVIESLPARVRNQAPGILGLWAALLDLKPNSKPSEILEEALSATQGPARVELLSGLVQRLLSRQAFRPDSQVETQLKSCLDELLSLDPSNIVAQSARLILDPSFSGEAMELPDISSVDVVALELNTRKRTVEEDAPRRTLPKKQKIKTAEQLEQEKKLDPERWLPKRDRTNYKPTKKDKQKVKGSHQGGIVDESLSSQGPAAKTGEVQRKKKNKKSKK